MIIRFRDIPEGKTMADYPEDTEFLWEDEWPSLYDDLRQWFKERYPNDDYYEEEDRKAEEKKKKKDEGTGR